MVVDTKSPIAVKDTSLEELCTLEHPGYCPKAKGGAVCLQTISLMKTKPVPSPTNVTHICRVQTESTRP